MNGHGHSKKIKTKINMSGVTLLEAMLVLSIMAFIIVMGLRQYQAYRVDSDLNQLRYQVNAIFTALNKYYFANCKDTTTIFSGASRVLNIQTDLVTPGYLDASAIARGPYVTTFIPSFIRNAAMNRYATNYPLNSMIGTAKIWRSRVTATSTSRSLTAGVIAKATGASSVTNPNTLTGTLTWERSVVVPSIELKSYSPMWSITPMVQQFNQMYTTMPIGILNYPNSTFSQAQSYDYCGSN